MTVGSQLRSCIASIKYAGSSLEVLMHQTKSHEAKANYKTAQKILQEIEADLNRQMNFITKEEPQYKQ